MPLTPFPSIALPIAPGYRLGRYEFLCPIAEGGMASVWLARLQGKHGFEKLLAIKTILPQYATDPKFQRMFLDEARIASKIEHTNVAQVLDLGDEQGILYLVMEWVDGDSLSRVMRAAESRGTLIPHGICLRMLADTCAGLHAAHELRGKSGEPLGVVHRDVSPQNILLASSGTAKVIDFGIAKARVSVDDAESTSGHLKGKIRYMAPEQALGRPLDRRADVWAVGAVLYHLTTGHPPFEGANQFATLHMLASGRAPSPLPATVPAPIESVIRRALAHDPELRYATAAELQGAIEQCMRDTALAMTVSDVAVFLADLLRARTRARREAIDLAMSAAAERQRVQGLLKPTADETNPPEPLGGTVLASETRVVGAAASEEGSIPPQLPSVTPAAPFESVSAEGIRVRQKGGRGGFAMGIALVALLLTMGVLLQRGRTPVSVGAASSVAVATGATVQPAPRPAEAVPMPSQELPPALSPDPSARAATAATMSAPRMHGPSTRPAPAAKARGASAPSCDPPFFFNDQGNRVFKKECL